MQTHRATTPRTKFRVFSLLPTVLVVAVTALACTSDPAVKKQQYLDSGNRYFEQGKYAEAIVEYRNAVEIDATFGPARKRLAEAFARMGDDRNAYREFIRAADLLPSDVDVQLNAGKLLLADRRPAEALARADSALKTEPENVDALVLRGNALSGLNSFEDALDSIEQAIKLDPGRGTTYTDLGFVELAQGRRDQAQAAFLKAVQLAPTQTRTILALANFYWSTGQTKDAEEAFEQALKIEPTNVEVNKFMAAFKYSTGRRLEAEPYLRRIAEKSPEPDGMLALADYYLLTARPKDAISTLQSLTSVQNLSDVKLRLARAYAASGDRAKAHELINQVLSGNSKDAGAHLLKGQILWQEGRREEAFLAIRTATDIAPSSAEAQFELGRVYASRGDKQAAQTAFAEVVRLNPRATVAQLQLAMLQSQTRPNESVRLAEEASRTDPGSLPARLALVRSLIAAGDFDRAEREIARLRPEYPDSAAVHAQDASLAVLKKDIPRARAVVERALLLDSSSIEVVGVAVALEIAQNNPAGARARLETRLSQGTTPELLVFAGRTYQALKDPAAAEKVLRQAIEQDPSGNDAYAILGSMYIGQNRIDEAIREYEALSLKQAKPVGPLTITGMLLERQGKVDAAMKKYDDALDLDSRAAVASNNLAWILAERGQDLERALQLAQTAVAGSPDKPEVLDTLGWVYYKRNQPSLAIPYFRQCAQMSPNVAEYHYHLGLALLQNGDKPNGRASLQRALDLKPNPTVAADVRRALERSTD
jgi:FimV-like protein